MGDIGGKLVGLCEAFNAHDLDGIMMFFAEDCVLEMPRAPHAWGARFEGKEAVRQGMHHGSKAYPMSIMGTRSTSWMRIGRPAYRNGH